jgi:hypothetical protein
VKRFTTMLLFAAGSCLAADQLTANLPSPNQRKPESPVQLEIGGRVGALLLHGPINAFRSIPVGLRTVPLNPGDDPCGCSSQVIPFDSLNPAMNDSFDFAGTLGLAIKHRVTIRGGVSYLLGYRHLGLNTSNEGVIREVNIFSGTFERGYGTSLVYYALKNAGVTPGIEPLGEIEVTVNKWLSIVVGGSYHTFAYQIQHGYDRYDAFQTLDDVPFATMQIYQPYIGVHLGGRFSFHNSDTSAQTEGTGFYFTAGPTILQPIHFAPAAQGTIATGGTHGLSIGVGYYLKHSLFQGQRTRTD